MVAYLALLGDSIFDNARYVIEGLSVIEHLRQELVGTGDRVALLAVDGHCIEDVACQLQALPTEATHLFISVGGNDALGYAAQLQAGDLPLARGLAQMAAMKTEFSQRYTQMLETVSALHRAITLCTIYDHCPTEDPRLQLLAFTALAIFNDCITRLAIERGLPLIDLRLVCNEGQDYSAISPIEPSSAGGKKIARCIINVLRDHPFANHRTVCYA